MKKFPASAAEMTPAWLRERLLEAGELRDAAEILSLSHEAIGTGQVGDTARITIEYDKPDAGPRTVAAKFASSDASSRATAALFGLYRKEVGFYRELAGKLETRTPRVYASEVTGDGSEFILLFEDLGPARGGNQLSGCTVEDARLGVIQAASIHAPTMNDSALAAAPWLQPVDGVVEKMIALYPQAHAVFIERYEGELEPELMTICNALNREFLRYFSHVAKERSVCHGDFRLDNMLFDARGGLDPIAIVDWQTVTFDCPLKDLGYFLGCGIGSAVRRPNEDDLLDLYCQEMSRRGVPLTRSAIWDRYRFGALHGVTTAVFSAAFVERTERGDANFLSMARNACELALDHDSIGALKSVL